MTPPEPSTHEDVAELLSLYAIDAAAPDEARRVEQHVARCAGCHAELQTLFEATNALAWAPSQQAMPSNVRANVLAKIDDEDVIRAPAAAKKRRRYRSFGSFRLVAPMAVCLVLALAAAGVQTARLASDSHLATPATSPAAVATSMTGSSHVIPISTRGQLDGVHAEYADMHGVGLIVTKGLPAPPAGYVYRVWGVTATHDMHPMGALAPHDGHNQMGVQPVDAPRRGEVASIEITLERADESPMRPAGPVVGSAAMV